MEILKNDNSKKSLITEYQFLAAALKIHDFSPNQWHHPSVSFPTSKQKYFAKYKYFFIQNLKRNNIDVIYETSRTEKSIVEMIINKDCFFKERKTVEQVEEGNELAPKSNGTDEIKALKTLEELIKNNFTT